MAHKEGEKCIINKIKLIHKKHELFSHLYNAKNTNIAVTAEEMNEFRDNWVETILKLKVKDVQRLGRLAYVQNNITRRR